MNALFRALTVTLWKSNNCQLKASATFTNSSVIEVWLINRLSVFIVTRNLNSSSKPIGCEAIEETAPVCTFEDGHISKGIRRSLT